MKFNRKIAFIIVSVGIVFVILIGILLVNPPGTLTAPFLIPRAYKNDIGEIVSLNIADGEKKGNLEFVYVINPNLKTYRLGVFSTIPDTTDYACLTIYAPISDNPNNISNLLSSPFQAQIIDRINITWEEGNVFIPHAVTSSCDEVLSTIPLSGGETGETLYYLGSITSSKNESHFLKLTSGQYIRLKCGTVNGSEAFSKDIGVLTSIVERYKLKDSFGI